MSTYNFETTPQPVRELLIGLIRQVPDPWAANLHFAIVHGGEWSPPVFQSSENLRRAYELVHSWAVGTHAVAIAMDIPGSEPVPAVRFLSSLCADLREQLAEFAAEEQDTTAS
jgi:hypothetical protein